jgi:hypothetical protein
MVHGEGKGANLYIYVDLACNCLKNSLNSQQVPQQVWPF